jgi:hypothetical protein
MKKKIHFTLYKNLIYIEMKIEHVVLGHTFIKNVFLFFRSKLPTEKNTAFVQKYTSVDQKCVFIFRKYTSGQMQYFFVLEVYS